MRARRFFERRGYTVCANWRFEDVTQGRYLKQLFKRLSVDCVLDVGANEGQYARFLRDFVDYRGQIISFEPIFELAENLNAAAAEDPRWAVHRLALGERAGEAELNVMRHTDLSSFHQPTATMTHVFSDINQVARIETVPVKTLADLMPELRRQYEFSHPYLKVDTQGHDLAVLRGAGREIGGFVAAQTELSFRSIYEGAPNWKDSLAFFDEMNFSVSNYFAIAHDENLRAIEFDCIVVNDRLPEQHA